MASAADVPVQGAEAGEKPQLGGLAKRVLTVQASRQPGEKRNAKHFTLHGPVYDTIGIPIGIVIEIVILLLLYRLLVVGKILISKILR